MALDPDTLAEVQASLFLVMHSAPPPDQGETVARHFFDLIEERNLDPDDVFAAILPVLPPLVRSFIHSPGRQP